MKKIADRDGLSRCPLADKQKQSHEKNNTHGFNFDYGLMLRDDRSDKAFDRLFVPVGTVEISAAFQRRGAEYFSAASCRDA